jgi:drug/metabolite transporter (DMT)-like permease
MSGPRATPARAALIAAFAAIYLFWSATFLAIRYAVAEIPPLLTIAIRCAGGAAVLLVWLAARGALVPVPRRRWPRIAAAGMLLFLGCHGLLAWAEQRVPSGEAALLMAAIPLWMVALDALISRRAPGRGVILGLGLGLAGVALLSGSGAAGAEGQGGLADRLWLVVSAFCWAAGSLVGRDREAAVPAAQATAMQLAAGSLVVLSAALVSGELAGWSPWTVGPRAVGSMVFLVLGGTVAGFYAYTWLLRVTTPAAVGTYAFVNPVVALGLAWLAGDGTLTTGSGLAALLVVAGVVVTWGGNLRRARGAAAAPAAPRAAAGDPRAGAAAALLRRAGIRARPAARAGGG